MPIVARYLSRLLLVRLLILLAGLSAMVVLLDLLANAKDIIASGGEDPLAMFRYAFLRFPDILSKLIPFSVLLATLLTLSRLVRHSELVALGVAGISPLRVLRAFLPAALLVVALQFWLEDQAVPASMGKLRAWGVGDYASAASTTNGKGGMTWIRQGENIVRVRAVERDNHSLSGLTIFRRDGEGNLVERIEAQSAEHVDGRWILHDVTRLKVAVNDVTKIARMPWEGNIRPSLFTSLSTYPRELSFMEVRRFVLDPGFGNRPVYLYETWLHKKIVSPLASLLMMLFAVPLAQRFQREGGIPLILVLGVAVGFLFFVFDGATLSLGEAGLLPPALAAWSPLLIFASGAAAIAFYFERR